MKRLTTLFLVIVTTIMLTACGGGGGDSSSDNRDTTTTSTAGRVLLSWVAPSTRADSSYLPLTELEGYRIYYGTTSSNLNILIDLNDSGMTEFTVDTLPSGNYYFTVTAYDVDGNESGFSNIINKDV